MLVLTLGQLGRWHSTGKLIPYQTSSCFIIEQRVRSRTPKLFWQDHSTGWNLAVIVAKNIVGNTIWGQMRILCLLEKDADIMKRRAGVPNQTLYSQFCWEVIIISDFVDNLSIIISWLRQDQTIQRKNVRNITKNVVKILILTIQSAFWRAKRRISVPFSRLIYSKSAMKLRDISLKWKKRKTKTVRL